MDDVEIEPTVDARASGMSSVLAYLVAYLRT